MRKDRVRYYLSGDVIHDVGIVSLVFLLEDFKRSYSNSINFVLQKNYLDVDYLDSEKFTKYITEEILFNIFKSRKKEELEKLFEISEYNNLTYGNFVLEVTNKLKDEKKLSSILKDYENISFPYMRNSKKYGTNEKNTNFKKRQDTFKILVNIVQESNIKIKRNDLSNYKVKNNLCEVCNLNKTTDLDLDFTERKDSKLLFTFKGSEESGFKNNGRAKGSNICFQCEFLNLMALLYINLRKPKNIIYINNLIDMKNINKVLNIKEKNFSEKELIRYLGKFVARDILIYRIIIDQKKGIILDLNKAIDIKWMKKEIKFLELIDGMNFSREASKKRAVAKILINNKNITALSKWFMKNIIVIEDDKESGKEKSNVDGKIDRKRSVSNLSIYYDFLSLKKKGPN